MSQPLQLFRLQQVDTQLDRVRQRLSEIEAALQDDSKLKLAKQQVETNEKTLQTAQRELKRAEQDVQAQHTKIEINQKKLYGGSIKNPKELEDLQNEAGALKRHLETLEERQLEKMIAAEDAESKLATARQRLEHTSQENTQQNEELSAEQKLKLQDVDKLENDRTILVNRIDEDDLSLYASLRKSGMGLAVAEVLDCCCSACGATLSASRAQAARSPSNITRCDSCGRVLYSS